MVARAAAARAVGGVFHQQEHLRERHAVGVGGERALVEVRSIGERPLGDSYSLSVPKVGIRQDGELGVRESPDRLELRVGNDVQTVPALPEHAYQAARLADLEVARPIHVVAHEEVPAEQRNARARSHPAPTRPRLGGREKQVKAPDRELIVDEPLAVAVCPQDTPGFDQRLRALRQGFAPFGLNPGCPVQDQSVVHIHAFDTNQPNRLSSRKAARDERYPSTAVCFPLVMPRKPRRCFEA